MPLASAIGWMLLTILVFIQLRFLILLCCRPSRRASHAEQQDKPRVAIQIATYRENLALPCLLKAIAELDWPRELFSVQVLDDSVGVEANETRAHVIAAATGGLNVTYHNREDRSGFKAGALNHGLSVADADFIAYFDADCRPYPDFLKKTLPHLADPSVAAVQVRWHYPNATKSPLTMIQAAAFEYLFAFEYPVRSALGLPAYYLGSAAVWRRQAINEVGGWRFEPFTAEDIDMGLQVSNSGWGIEYEDSLLADDDAVEDILAFRAQQRRWAQAVLQAGISAAPNVPCRFFSKPLTSMMDWTSFFPHALIPLTFLLTFLLSIWVLFLPPEPILFWLFSALMIVSPATLALAAAQMRLHRDWRGRLALLVRAGPYAAATMTSFLFGFADMLKVRKLEFVATPKAGQSGVLAGGKLAWLKAHRMPVLFDLSVGVLFLGAALAGAVAGTLSAVWPLAMMGTLHSLSGALTVQALNRAA